MARPTKHQFRYKNVGRTSRLTEEMITKLEQCALIRATVKETCSYANISGQTYARWMRENPELSERLEDLRQNPFIKARQTIIAALNDVGVSFRFLEKEKPDEYGERLNVKELEHDGGTHPEDDEIRRELKERLKANIRRRAAEKFKNKANEKE